MFFNKALSGVFTTLQGSQLYINMASGVATSLTAAIILAVTYPIYLQRLGYEQYGLWLLLATVLTFSQIGNLGIAQAVARQVAEAYGQSDSRAVQECVTTAVCTLAFTGSLVFAMVLFGNHIIVTQLGLNAANTAIAHRYLPYIGLLSLYVFVVDAINAALAGLGRMDLCNYSQLGSQALAAASSILLLNFGFGLTALFIGNAVAYLTLHLASAYYSKQLLGVPLISLRAFSFARLKRLVGFGSALTGGAVAAMLINPFNKLMLARYAGLANIPVYDLAFTLSMRARNIFDSSQRAIVPEVSRAFAIDSNRGLVLAKDVNRRSMRLLIATSPAYVLVALIATPALRLWLRSNFDPSSPLALRIVIVGMFLSLLGMPAYYALIGLGRGSAILISNVLQSVANVLIILFFLALYSRVSVNIVLLATSVGMAVSTTYVVLTLRCLTRPDKLTVEKIGSEVSLEARRK